MIFSYLVHLVIVELIWCIHLPDEIYPKGSAATPAYRHIQTTKEISNDLTSDATIITNENYFPSVIYPNSILDVAQPFFYRVNAQDQVLGPFSEDVKSSYKLISSNTGDSKNINNYILKYISQSQENLESGTVNNENICSESGSKENEDNDEFLSQISNENINNPFEDKFMTNSHNTCLSSSTSANQTDSVADVEDIIASSHVENVLKDTSDEGGHFLENLEIPIEENVHEIYSTSDLKRQEVMQGNNVTQNSKIYAANETNEVILEKDFTSKNIDLIQNTFLDNHNLTSNKVIVMNLNETLPPLPVGCFESRNITSNILTKSTEESSLLPLEESLNMSSKVSCSNSTIGHLVNNETDLHPEQLLLSTLENDTYSDYDHNCTDINNDDPESQDDSDEFFLDMIISLDSIYEMNDTFPNKDIETSLMEIPTIDRTNISLHNVNASQENIYKY